MLSPSLTVVVIEDDTEIALLIVEVLEAAGFRSARASSGREGLRLVQTLKPDAVVCDVCMPGMDGVEVVRALKADVRTARIPIVLMSGSGDGSFQHAAADRFVAKPFQLPEMLEAVSTVLTGNALASCRN